MEEGKLLFQAINVNDSVTKSKFDNVYGCRHSLVDSIKRALGVLISGKVAMVCGYGGVGKGSAVHGERNGSCHGFRDRSDSALQACMSGYQVTTIEDALETADISSRQPVTRTSSPEHISKMKDQAIVCNIGHFDNEIQVAGGSDGRSDQRVIKDDSVPGGPVSLAFSDGRSVYLLAEGRLINLGCATGHPSFVMSNSFRSNHCSN